MKRNILAFGAIALASAISGIYFSASKITPAAPSAALSPVVAQLFKQSLPDSNGKEQPLAQFQGKALVLNFWATWCAPCVQEMPELSGLQAELTPKDVQLLGIGIDSPSNIAEFATKYKIAYPLYVAGMSGTELSRQLGNAAGGLPFTVLIGRDGQVKKTYLGRLKLAELRGDIASM
jgi:peroxiredoxin